jgi:hypothetical protein
LRFAAGTPAASNCLTEPGCAAAPSVRITGYTSTAKSGRADSSSAASWRG